MNPHACLELSYQLDHLGAAADRAQSVVAGRRSLVFVGKDGQNSVADELVHIAVVSDDDLHHGPHVLVEKIDHHPGILLFAERSEAADIGKQNSHQQAASGEGDPLLFGNLGGELLPHEDGNRFLKEGATLFGGQEAVDHGGQQADQAAQEKLGGGDQHAIPEQEVGHHSGCPDRRRNPVSCLRRSQ